MMATEVLRREHEAVALMRGIVDEISARLEAGEFLDLERLERVVEFVKGFADSGRLAKEEDIALPATVTFPSPSAVLFDESIDLDSYHSPALGLSAEFKNRIAIVIATLNEEDGFAELLEECRRYASELIVVDGHSKDRTAEIAARAGATVLFDNGKGKGDAFRVAIPHISKEITVFLDADWSHDPADIPRLVQPILEDQADHVTGSRLLGGSAELHGGFDEFMRLMGSSFITACIGWRFKQRLSDSQNGFRAIRTEVLRRLDLQENITTIEQEMIIKTLKGGFRLSEVPTHEYKRKYNESHISIRKVWLRYVSSMLKYLFF